MNNRIRRIILQSFYLGIGFVAIMASLGLFRADYQDNWYIYFTNLSNYYCIAMMTLCLIESVKTEKTYNHKYQSAVFCGLVMISVTFVVFNTVLAGAPDRDQRLNYEAASVLMHVILPILYVTNWFVSFEKGKTKYKNILYSLVFPLVYVTLIMIRAPFVKVDPLNPDIKKVPYFFLDIDQVGAMGLVKWIIIVFGAFGAFGLIYVTIDKLLSRYKKDKN